ncbi:lipopolysaccharide biosynthesis protein [Treponema bryantii]|uniref:lipopolysaccharide biosynthesis protein n=1 Tax=Treponema bryantii TaxID=163 RepID=UPI0003B30060|nr:polysaccharide biosynthesis C-terminal domain-containing protein [Treponema bryantii]
MNNESLQIKKSRSENVIHNSAWALFNFLVTGFLSLITRKVFVQFLQVEYLGLNGLFSNVLGWFSLAELGIASVISYNLYKELGNNNIDEINVLMSIYKVIYAVIGCAITSIGAILLLFLPILIKDNEVSLGYSRIIYLIQLTGNVSSYFLAYRRTLFICDQKEYTCIRIDIIVAFIAALLRITVIIIFHSFVLYSFVTLLQNIVANCVIYIVCKRRYSYLKSVKISKKEITDRNIFKDVKNLLVQKISLLVYTNTDNIIITKLLGLKTTGVVANYVLVTTAIQQLMYSCLKGVVPSVGNLVHTESKERVLSVYNKLDIFYFIFGSVVACDIIVCMQPFIQLFFGENYLLPFGYVIGIAIDKHIGMQFENAYNFRSALGKFEQDRKWWVFSAVANIVFSVLLVKYFGIVGIITGTIVAFVFIAFGRIQFVFKNILTNASVSKYFLKHFLWTLLFCLQMILVVYVMSKLPKESWMWLFIRFIIASFCMLFMQIVTFLPSKDFKSLIVYVKESVNKTILGRRK